ncbi:MAG: Flp/Fap pilin component [Nocardioidaceae bacterium]|nr:Flp/Fap pilin component [Nocardioidaceae bacterium]
MFHPTAGLIVLTAFRERDSLCHGDESGASAVEYSLLVSLVAGAIILMVGILGQSVIAAFQSLPAAWP